MLIKKNLVKSERNLKLLSENLNHLCHFLDEVYDINSGGCCYIAGLIAKLLEDDNVGFSVIVYECDCEDFYDLDCSQYHYAITFNTDIINADDYDEVEYSSFDNVSSKDLFEHYQECCWNEQYNPGNNKFIKDTIKTFYGNFTKNLREQ